MGKVQTFLRKKLYPYATGIIAQTEKAKQIYAMQFSHNNVKVIGNPIREVNLNYQSSKSENIVLSIGRLIETKHFDKLIEMFVNIKEPGWKLIIVGDDALKQNNMLKLHNLLEKLNAQDKVYLVGRQQDVEKYYLKSKIFAFTSSSEGFPNVIGEALSAGIPVVAFDCIAGPSDMIIDNQNGFLVPLFEYEQFENKLRLLMQDEKLRECFGEKAQQSVQKFSVNEIGAKYLSFLTQHQ